jgi:hypothetical protein
MHTKGSFNNLEEKNFTIKEDCIYSSENPGYFDAKLKTTILTTLTWYSHTPLERITVSVKHGFVSLSGMVPWTYQKMVIASMVQNIKGVQGIVNNIAVANKLPQIASVVLANS